MTDIDVVCFYLPQFYRTEENNTWWGPGFTEWTNVAKARPVFPGHHQPHIPGQLGFYDTTHPGTLLEQVNLAQSHGVGAFCFYHYWFSGKRVLEKPVDLFCETKTDFPFFLCWANENWTKNWDGGNREILLPQNYDDGFEADFFTDIVKYFKQPNYKKINNAPILLIYRPEDFPNPKKSLGILRELAHSAGFNGLYIAAVSSFGTFDPRDVGADSIVEFPPLGTHHAASATKPRDTQKDFHGHFYNYGLAAEHSARMRHQGFYVHRGVMPGWDNTPRRQNDSTIFLGATPEIFQAWLAHHLKWTSENNDSTTHPPMVFVNAWNEWAEGAHLEPDRISGTKYIEQIKLAKGYAKQIQNSTVATKKIQELLKLETNEAEGIWQWISKLRRLIAPIRTSRAVLNEISLTNLKRMLELLKMDPTGRRLFEGAKSAVKNLSGVGYRWQARTYVQEHKTQSDKSLPKLTHVFSAHVFYEDYVDRIKAIASSTDIYTKYLITSPSEKIVGDLSKYLASLGVDHSVKLTPNRGRNFGPTLVEFSEEILKFDLVTHLHSKKSTHTVRRKAVPWANRSWALLAEKEQLVNRLNQIILNDPTIGIAYDLVTDIVPYTSFAWHSNIDLAQAFLPKEMLRREMERFPFPAGGMFTARVTAIEGLLKRPHKYSDFPEELGQIDGTHQHMIERAIGLISLESGFRHLIYDSTRDLFTTDYSYIWGPE